MSQRDLVAELRGARLAAPDHLREQVRLIAGSAKPPAKRFTWRRALVVALPVAAAVAAVVVLTRPAGRQTAQPEQSVALRTHAQTSTVDHGATLAPKSLDRSAPSQSSNGRSATRRTSRSVCTAATACRTASSARSRS